MDGLLISVIAAHLGGTVVHARGDERVGRAVSSSSSSVEPGGIFVAIRGHTADGHRFVSEAISRGAALSVVEDEKALQGAAGIVVPNTRLALSALAALVYGEPSKELKVIGITGTNGKTTTNWIVYHALNRLGCGALRIGTLGSECMGKGTQDGSLTSPDAISVQRLMREALDQGARSCVMEVSSHALDQARVEDVHFDVGVFTNLTRDHLDYHKTIDHYFQAKCHLFTLLKRADNKAFAAVINLDDPYGEKVWQHVGALGFRDYSFGRDERARFRISAVNETHDAMVIEVVEREHSERIVMRAPFIGAHNAENLVAAMCALVGLGFTPKAVVAALSETPQVPGRLERVGQGGPRVFVDYAHTPDALARALEALRVSTEGMLWCVFGCGGDRDAGKRPMMGTIAASGADRVVVTSDNPRTENPRRIIDDILASGIRPVMIEADRGRAITQVIAQAGERDTVLIAGKGHEDYQIIGTTKIHFSDQEVTRAALAARR